MFVHENLPKTLIFGKRINALINRPHNIIIQLTQHFSRENFIFFDNGICYILTCLIYHNFCNIEFLRIT